MEVITPVSPEKDYSDKKIVFLAGPIKGAPNWQEEAIKDLSDLDIYVANPRRENVKNFNLDLQIAWESRFLAAADLILFWIPPKEEDIAGREYAQTSRFELGEWAAKTNYNKQANTDAWKMIATRDSKMIAKVRITYAIRVI